MALQCDLMIMAENAFLLSPFTTISLVPDGGLNWLLVHQIGYRRAFQLSVESERIQAARCVELGLANKAVPADQLQEAALEWAQALAKRAPLSVAATKKVMRFAAEHGWPEAYDMEAKLQGELLGCEDNKEGIEAFFEKREPNFKGK
jgi:2-(1,2-epoxy-1,2-dihydrophenyl)acetyl-CoA isomerase